MTIDFENWRLMEEAARGFVAQAGVDLLDPAFDPDHWRQMVEMGWIGMCAPEARGGLGEHWSSLVPILNVTGPSGLVEPIAEVAGVAVPLLARVGDTNIAASDLLEQAVAGAAIPVTANFEPEAGHARTVGVTAVPDGNQWRISGKKLNIRGVDRATHFLVSARCDGAVSLFIVPLETPGAVLLRYQSLDGRMLGALELSDARLHAECRVIDSAEDAICAMLDRASILVLAEATGVMQALLDDTLDHLRGRHQFGRPLSNFQVLQHRAVDLFIAMEETRAVVEAALRLDDHSPDARALAVSTAKVVGSRSARLIASEAVQMHGGLGITEELRVSHLYRRLIAAQHAFGDEAWHLDRFAELRAAATARRTGETEA